MTCKDCIHLQPNTEHCNEYDIEVDVKPYRICAEMVSKDGTYHNGTEHCPRCGKAVDKWGLCDECRKMYEDMRCINDEERKSWDLLIAKKNYALFQSMLCRQEDNSWESVSK